MKTYFDDIFNKKDYLCIFFCENILILLETYGQFKLNTLSFLSKSKFFFKQNKCIYFVEIEHDVQLIHRILLNYF